VDLPIHLKPGSSRVIGLPLLSLPAVSVDDYRLVGQITDPNSDLTHVVSPDAYSLVVPTVALIPSRGLMVTQRNGTAVVSFVVTNEGNVAPVGLSVTTLYASPNGTTSDGTQLISGPQSLLLPPDRSRAVHIHLTAALRTEAIKAGMLVIQVIDPTSQSQVLTVTVKSSITILANEAK
jgi:hypothetical protein